MEVIAHSIRRNGYNPIIPNFLTKKRKVINFLEKIKHIFNDRIFGQVRHIKKIKFLKNSRILN